METDCNRKIPFISNSTFADHVLICCNFLCYFLAYPLCSRVPYPKIGFWWSYLTLLFSQDYQPMAEIKELWFFWMRAGKYHFPFMTLWWHLSLHLLTVQMTTWCWYLKGFGFEISGNWQWTLWCLLFGMCYHKYLHEIWCLTLWTWALRKMVSVMFWGGNHHSLVIIVSFLGTCHSLLLFYCYSSYVTHQITQRIWLSLYTLVFS